MRLGPYELEAELGRGGYGRVFRARHLPTGALRALKILEGLPDQESVERFRREAQTLASLERTGVVRVHEAGSEGGRLYFVMELMPGGSLRQRLRTTGRMPWREAAALVAKLARTLERCHGTGLVHRDVKPENVLFDEQGEPRLADFGCVRDLKASFLTRSGIVLGTSLYMAPELMSGGRPLPPSDVFSLGVLLQELVTGERPYGGSDMDAVRDAVAMRRATLDDSGVTTPPALEPLVRGALEPNPASRVTARELADSLERLLAGEAILRQPAPAPRRKGKPLVLLAALSLLTVAGLAFLVRPDRWFATAPETPPVPDPVPPVPAPPPLGAPSPEAPRPDGPHQGGSSGQDGARSRRSFEARVAAEAASFTETIDDPESYIFVQGLKPGVAATLAGTTVQLDEDLTRLVTEDPAAYLADVAPIVSEGWRIAIDLKWPRKGVPYGKEAHDRRDFLERALEHSAEQGSPSSKALIHFLQLLPDDTTPAFFKKLTFEDWKRLATEASALHATEPIRCAAFLTRIVLWNQLFREAGPEEMQWRKDALEEAAGCVGPAQPDPQGEYDLWVAGIAHDDWAAMGHDDYYAALTARIRGDLEKQKALLADLLEWRMNAYAWGKRLYGGIAFESDAHELVKARLLLDRDPMKLECKDSLDASVDDWATDTGPFRVVLRAEIARRRHDLAQAERFALSVVEGPPLSHDEDKSQSLVACARAILLLVAIERKDKAAVAAEVKALADVKMPDYNDPKKLVSVDPEAIGWSTGELDLLAKAVTGP